MRSSIGVIGALAIGGAAYATSLFPNSTLAGWVDVVVGWVSEWGQPEAATPSSSSAGTEGTTLAGVAVSPGRVLTIRFTVPAPRHEGAARISLTAGRDVEVRAAQEAATFFTDAGLLEVRVAGAATFDVLIPESAPRVEIVVGENRIFLKDGARIVTELSRDTAGFYVLPLSAALAGIR